MFLRQYEYSTSKPPECLNGIESVPIPLCIYPLNIWKTDNISISSLKIEVDILSKMRILCVLFVFQLNASHFSI